MLDLQEAVRLQSCQVCYNRLPSVASKKSNRAWRSDSSWRKKVNVLQINIPLTLCRCTGISFFLWIFQCKKRDGCNFGSIFWASYDFGKRSRGSVWLPQPLQSFISESNRSCTFFLCIIGTPRSTTLQREREVTCEAWGDNRLYWKWDYLVPEACYRE